MFYELNNNMISHGNQGLTGPHENQGLTGPHGNQGLTGPHENQGLTGTHGNQGLTGTHENQGLNGSSQIKIQKKNYDDDDEDVQNIYVLSVDNISICCSQSFETLQEKMDILIKEIVSKYMESNNVYVSNNGDSDYTVSIIYKNSIWPVEKCVGRFVINKVKCV